MKTNNFQNKNHGKRVVTAQLLFLSKRNYPVRYHNFARSNLVFQNFKRKHLFIHMTSRSKLKNDQSDVSKEPP